MFAFNPNDLHLLRPEAPRHSPERIDHPRLTEGRLLYRKMAARVSSAYHKTQEHRFQLTDVVRGAFRVEPAIAE